MTTLYARYYQGDEMVAQNELAKTADLTQDVERKGMCALVHSAKQTP